MASRNERLTAIMQRFRNLRRLYHTQMAISTYVLEEHHEAFFAWTHAHSTGQLPIGGGMLLHVDHHADLAIPYCRRSLHEIPTDLAGAWSFTYDELTIESFLYAAFYAGFFDEMTWIGHGEPFARIARHVYRPAAKPHTLIVCQDALRATLADRRAKRLYLSGQAIVTALPSAAWTALDIDLDFFSCDPLPGTIRAEVTKDEYERYRSDPYHPMRLHSGCRVVTQEEAGRYYLVESSHDGENLSCRRSEEQILGLIAALVTSLTNSAMQPKVVTVCRSHLSGYTPGRSSRLDPIASA